MKRTIVITVAVAAATVTSATAAIWTAVGHARPEVSEQSSSRIAKVDHLARTTAPRLAPQVASAPTEAPEMAEPSPEEPLAALDREAQALTYSLAAEQDPERRAKLDRYARAVDELRNSLR